jgi:hypothetical protein
MRRDLIVGRAAPRRAAGEMAYIGRSFFRYGVWTTAGATRLAINDISVK